MAQVNQGKTFGNGCISARGSLNTWGYGRLKIKGKEIGAHVLSYLLFNGSIPKGKQIDHICRNRKCINPKHLRVVTVKENVLAGESVFAKNSRKTHCVKGHPFSLNNTYINPHNNRECRVCRKIAQEKFKTKAENICNHEWGTDEMHRNEYCKKCYKTKAEGK